MRTSLLVLAAAAAAAHAADSVSVSIHGTPVSIPLPVNFVGFSYEVSCAIQMFGSPSPRTSFANLMKVLQGVSGGAGPNIRIGGNSADESVYIPGTSPLPNGDTYRISDADFQSYLAAVPLWKGSITPGLNFRDGANASLAVAHAAALSKVVGPALIANFEVGNENDLYHNNGIRSSSYSREDYAKEWEYYVAELSKVVPMPGVQGGTFCCNQTGFDLDTPSILQNYAHKAINSFSEHFYPLSVCNKRKDYNSVWDLLTDKAASSRAAQLAPLAALSTELSLPFLIGEGNSVSCGGQYNVSDTFASALWSVDAMFYFAAANFSGFRFHGCPGGAYTAIAYSNVSSLTDPPQVNPLFYGMWAFATATQQHSQVVSADVSASDGLIHAWVTRQSSAGGDVYRVTVIHKNGNSTAPAQVTVTPPSAPTASGTLVRLAPASGGVYAKNGITFAGQTFDGSPDGTPQGSPASESVPITSSGTFAFAVQPASITILTFTL